MELNEIRQELIKTEEALKDLIRKITINITADKTGLKYQDIQAFLKGRRRWSYKKILKISEELDIT